MPNRAISDWIASLPRDREFTIYEAYDMLLRDHPKQAPTKARASMAITKSGLFESWHEGRMHMFRYRGEKDE